LLRRFGLPLNVIHTRNYKCLISIVNAIANHKTLRKPNPSLTFTKKHFNKSCN
jgi:hypothetical protein